MEMEWEDWYEKYAEVFEEETGIYPPFEDKAMSEPLYNKGWPPEKAAKSNARFMLTGE